MLAEQPHTVQDRDPPVVHGLSFDLAIEVVHTQSLRLLGFGWRTTATMFPPMDVAVMLIVSGSTDAVTFSTMTHSGSNIGAGNSPLLPLMSVIEDVYTKLLLNVASRAACAGSKRVYESMP